MSWIIRICLPFVVDVVRRVVRRVTPEVREELVEHVNEWAEKCYATSNKWDDIAADFVKRVLMVPPIKEK